MCKNIQEYTKTQASVQHDLYLFTCEISSVNRTPWRYTGVGPKNIYKEIPPWGGGEKYVGP